MNSHTNKTNTIPSQTKRSKLSVLGKLNTPQLLKVGLCLTWGTSLLLLVVTISGVQAYRHAIKTVGKDSAPSIVVAQRLKDALAGMDANAVKELLIQPGQNLDVIKDYEERRQQLANRLVAAAENITYGDAERKPIQTLQLGVGDYLTSLQQARDAHQRGDIRGTIDAYRAAGGIMDNILLPAADALDKANLDALDSTYTEQEKASLVSLFFVEVSGLLLLGSLLWLQLFLSNRMHRTLNPLLLGATAITIIFLGYTTRAFLSSSENLKVATKDAFTSMHALRQARALTYGATGDEGRYLLDKALAPTHTQAFFSKVNRIAKLPDGQTFQTIVAASAQGQKVEGFTGFLANELNNVTFPGEQEAAVGNLATFEKYLSVDKQIRQLENSGKHQEAIALYIGKQPEQGFWAFDNFRTANQKVFDINEEVFDGGERNHHSSGKIGQGFQDLEGFEVTTPIALALIGFLALLGTLPRLKEYSI